MNAWKEHSYAKTREEDNGALDDIPMETTPVANADDIIVNVTQLDKNHDTFESLLLELLKSHGSYKQSGEYGINCENKITQESLDTLSPDQISRIANSSTANYQAIQHILKSKQDDPLTPVRDHVVGLISEVPAHSPSSNSTSSIFNSLDQSPLTNSTGSTVSVDRNGPSDHASATPTAALSSPGAKSPLISIKISPEQLKNLQSHLTEMFKQQNLHIPEDLSAEQKQMVLNSLITHQLNTTLQQLLPGASAALNTRPPSSSSSSTASTTLPNNNSGQEGVASALLSGAVTGKVAPVGVVAPITSTSSNSGSNSTGDQLMNSVSIIERIEQKREQKSEEQPKKKKDPDSKRPPTAFNIFFSEMYPIVQEQQHINFSEASKMVSGLWSGLGQEGKKKYYDKCDQLRSEFNSRVKDSAQSDNTTLTDQNSVAMKSPSTVKKKHVKPVAVAREKEEGMCVHEGCYNMAVAEDDRGKRYCCNECVVNHSKIIFHNWVSQRRLKT